MRIPRTKILASKEVIESIVPVKFVQYRDLVMNIDRTNFHVGTKVDFKAVEQNPDHKNIHETFGRLKHELQPDYHFKSKTGSEYFIDDNDNLYRLSNHWGAVSSCEWTREGVGQLMMSVFDYGDWEIGVANLKDFKVFRRKVESKKNCVINPIWYKTIKQVVPIKQLLETFKNSIEFNDISNERKHFIGENYGYFRKVTKDLRKYERTIELLRSYGVRYDG